MNIRLSYLYRDYSNYKNFNEVIFSNSANALFEVINSVIQKRLIEGQWFYASEWQLPDLHFENWDIDDDHFLHEFVSLEETIELTTAQIDISDFLEIVKNAKATIIQHETLFHKRSAKYLSAL